jgi:hypothetical protein
MLYETVSEDAGAGLATGVEEGAGELEERKKRWAETGEPRSRIPDKTRRGRRLRSMASSAVLDYRSTTVIDKLTSAG